MVKQLNLLRRIFYIFGILLFPFLILLSLELIFSDAPQKNYTDAGVHSFSAKTFDYREVNYAHKGGSGTIRMRIPELKTFDYKYQFRYEKGLSLYSNFSEDTSSVNRRVLLYGEDDYICVMPWFSEKTYPIYANLAYICSYIVLILYIVVYIPWIIYTSIYFKKTVCKYDIQTKIQNKYMADMAKSKKSDMKYVSKSRKEELKKLEEFTKSNNLSNKYILAFFILFWVITLFISSNHLSDIYLYWEYGMIFKERLFNTMNNAFAYLLVMLFIYKSLVDEENTYESGIAFMIIIALLILLQIVFLFV